MDIYILLKNIKIKIVQQQYHSKTTTKTTTKTTSIWMLKSRCVLDAVAYSSRTTFGKYTEVLPMGHTDRPS